MSWASVVSSRLRGMFGQRPRDRELEEEVQFHLAMQTEEYLRTGMTPDEARYKALRSFGGIEPMKETYREQRTFAVIETIAQDIRYALRMLFKSPGFTVTSVTTLALAIGANTAMLSVLNAVIFRPLPYRSPEQLTTLWTEVPTQNIRAGRSSNARIEDWRRQSKTFAGMAAFDFASVTLSGGSETEKISIAWISPDFLRVLGVQPLHGRSFTTAESEQQQRLALISHRFWQTRFGGSPDALGASIELDGMPSRIIGIIPADSYLLNADAWEPYTLSPDWTRGANAWSVLGRLREDVTVAQAQAEMTIIARRLDALAPIAERDRGVSVMPLSLYVTGSHSRAALWMLAGAVLFVLLIAGSNAASLSLARSAGRARELSIRAALGASAARIARQLICESVTLAVISGTLGTLLALGFIRLIRIFGPRDIVRLNEAGLDLKVLGWALAISCSTGILVGLAPAMTMLRRNSQSFGQEGGRSVSAGVAARVLRRGLVMAEFALAIVLLAGAGLLVRSWWSVERVDPGFRPAQVLSLQLATTTSTPPAERASFYNRVLEQIKSVPGVESAGIIGDLFIGSAPEQVVTASGSEPQRFRLRRDEVSNELFKAVGAPLLRGRLFSSVDRPDSPPAAIVNDAMSRRLWPGQDPLGKRFKLGPAASNLPWFTVVGVVGDMRRQGLENEPIPQVFEPLVQNPSRLATLLVRTSTNDPLKLGAALQSAIHQVEKRAPVYGVTTLENRLGDFLVQRRFQTALLIGFSIVALLMAAIGIYGLIQYSIATRTQEIGIRMAIGARPGDIFRMVIREGLKLSLTGLALGLVGALWLGQVGSSLLFGVNATDPLTFTAVSLLLTLSAAAACYFPARRAMKVEPIAALRQS